MRKVVPVEARTTQNYLKYIDSLKDLSQENRRIPTTSEKTFWNMVLSRDKTGYRFLRQKPVGQLILDFYCSKLALDIEIDGGYHLSKQNYDKARDKYLEDRGIKTIRYTNFLVDYEISKVVEDLKKKIGERLNELKIK